MTVIPTSSNPLVNSTTYVDLLGFLVGLERMPGEPSDVFAARVARAGALSRTANYVGLMNELHLQFGFDLSQAISIDDPATYTVWVDLAGVHLRAGSISVDSPLTTIDVDGFWAWRMLSAVVADLNAAAGVGATLLVDDGPAFQLPNQANTMLAVAEPISGQIVQLAHQGLQAGTEVFNVPVQAYTVSDGSTLLFKQALPAGVRVTYQYQVVPYALISSPVFLIGMADPNLAVIAAIPGGGMAYQMSEFIQALANQDLSYWAQ